MPSAFELIRRVLLVTGEAVVLYAASRLVFEWVLRTAWGRAPVRRVLAGILRFPGNILHETSHALGYLLAGYRVRRLVPFFLDREGRGYCQPGKRWSPVALPWLATGFAALMPLAVGACALWAASVLLRVPDDPSTLASADWRRLAAILTGLDYHSWRTWLFLYLALSIGAELAPSEIDLRKCLPAVLAGAAVLMAAIVTIFALPAAEPLRHPAELYLGWALSWASTVLDFGIVAIVLVGIPAAILAAPLRRRR